MRRRTCLGFTPLIELFTALLSESLRYVKTVHIFANMSSFAAEHRIKRPMHICILHRIVFTFLRYQIIVPCSKLVFLPGAACLLLDDLGLTGAPAADGFGELDSATRPSSARPEQCRVLCA